MHVKYISELTNKHIIQFNSACALPVFYWSFHSDKYFTIQGLVQACYTVCVFTNIVHGQISCTLTEWYLPPLFCCSRIQWWMKKLIGGPNTMPPPVKLTSVGST